ncbi:hypothetical protein IB234_07640 [Pseudomonas sp. PDM16]|uniref:hypothetical protein n=1 Tax=Pseudomonas sp. PDM16 TaxID=2769292 RepID=UPI00177B2E23|nr:hypothetical protein [Pseudomonas sp. PDM16]MBD9414432.1 hypothetical protein [Pseudomonas sp. PDM16]
MKLEIARGLFLIGALGITALATAAWQEPGPQVLDSVACAQQQCPVVSARHGNKIATEVNGENLMLLAVGLSHALKGEQ